MNLWLFQIVNSKSFARPFILIIYGTTFPESYERNAIDDVTYGITTGKELSLLNYLSDYSRILKSYFNFDPTFKSKWSSEKNKMISLSNLRYILLVKSFYFFTPTQRSITFLHLPYNSVTKHQTWANYRACQK